ncbi:hypothetical protein HMPREF1548_01662 [Clostridium sp. KLE 1755]|nr:hypothetical protein HMPREF1548_01662 [Clostridium sp. KLE 1755]
MTILSPLFSNKVSGCSCLPPSFSARNLTGYEVIVTYGGMIVS